MTGAPAELAAYQTYRLWAKREDTTVVNLYSVFGDADNSLNITATGQPNHQPFCCQLSRMGTSSNCVGDKPLENSRPPSSHSRPI